MESPIGNRGFQKQLIMLCLGLFLSTFAFGEQRIEVLNALPGDTLIMYKSNNNKILYVHSGDKMKVKCDDNLVMGSFLSVNDSTLTLLVNQHENILPVSQIEKIWLYNPLSSRVMGVSLMILGAGGMAFGGISLVVGSYALATASLGAIVLVAVPPLAIGGLGLFSLGNRLHSRKLDTKKKWSFKQG